MTTDNGTNFASPPPAPAPTGQRAQRWRLMRSSDGMIGGVAGGFAAATGYEVTLVRLAFVAAGLSGFGIIAYLVLWLVMPRQDAAAGDVLLEAPDDTRRWLQLAVVVGGVAGLLRLFVDGPLFLNRDGFALGLLLIIAGAVLLFWRRRDDRGTAPRPTVPPSGSATPPASRPTSPTGPFPASSTSLTWAPPHGDAATRTTVDGDVEAERVAAGDEPLTTQFPPAPPSGAPSDGRLPAALPPLPPASPAATPASAIVARVIGWLVALISIPIAITIVAAHNIGALSISLPGLMLALGAIAIVNLIVWSSLARRAGPVIGAIAALLAVGGVVAAVSTWQGEIGEEIATPTSIVAVNSPYEMAVGHQVIDLTRLADDPAANRTTDPATDDPGTGVPGDDVELQVVVDHGIGYTEVIVPNDVTVDVTADIQAGSIEVFDERRSGWNTSLSTTSPPTDTGANGAAVDASVYELDLEMGFGRLQVCREADAEPRNGHLECRG